MSDRSPPLLAAEGLGRSYRAARGRTVRALAGAGLEIAAGETVAVVGASGCGKSTLVRCLCLMETADEGRLLYRGRDTAAMSPAERRRVRRRLQLVFQDPARALNPRWTGREIVAEPLRIAVPEAPGAGPPLETSVDSAVAALGLDPRLLDRRAGELSGGQRQRLAIARALVARPRMLVLDEALSGLDPSVSARVLNLLATLSREHGVACVHVSHDLAAVRYLADRVVVLDGGRIVETGSAAAIFERPRAAPTRALVAATPAWPPRPRRAPGAAP